MHKRRSGKRTDTNSSTPGRTRQTPAHYGIRRLCVLAHFPVRTHVGQRHQESMGRVEHRGLQPHAPVHPYRKKLLESVAKHGPEGQADGTDSVCIALGTASRVEDQRLKRCPKRQGRYWQAEARELGRLCPISGGLCAIPSPERRGARCHLDTERARLGSQICRLHVVGR